MHHYPRCHSAAHYRQENSLIHIDDCPNETDQIDNCCLPVYRIRPGIDALSQTAMLPLRSPVRSDALQIFQGLLQCHWIRGCLTPVWSNGYFPPGHLARSDLREEWSSPREGRALTGAGGMWAGCPACIHINTEASFHVFMKYAKMAV